MKRYLSLLFCLLPALVFAQVNNPTNTNFSNGLGATKFFNTAAGTTEPTTGVREGSLFFNTVTSKLRMYNGSQWVNVGDVAGFVPTSRTVNGHPLSADVTVTKSDVGLGNVLNVDASNPANITQSSTYRFVMDTEKTTWNAKATLSDFSATAPITYSAGVIGLSATISQATTFNAATSRPVKVDRALGVAGGFGIQTAGVNKMAMIVGTDENAYLQMYAAGTGTALGQAIAFDGTTGRASFPMKVTFTQGSTATASGNIPLATGTPGSMVDGDFYLNTTALFIRYNNVTRTMANTDQSQTFLNKLHSTGSTWQGNTIATGYGGTGLTIFSTGDLFYASNPTTMAGLGAVATGSVLKSGTFPSWGKVALGTEVLGILPTANGGTGLTNLGSANQSLRVNAGGTALEYYTPSAGSSGTVTSVSVTTANGVSGTVATATTTPAITLSLGAITPTSVNGTTATEIGYVSGATSNIQTQLNNKAPLVSPALTGTPTAPTAAPGTNTTQIATMAALQAALANYSQIVAPVEISGTSQTAVPNAVHIPHNAAMTTITLPSSAPAGTVIIVIGEGAGKWRVQHGNATDQIYSVGGFTTVAGTTHGVEINDKDGTSAFRKSNTNKWTVSALNGVLSAY